MIPRKLLSLWIGMTLSGRKAPALDDYPAWHEIMRVNTAPASLYLSLPPPGPVYWALRFG